VVGEQHQSEQSDRSERESGDCTNGGAYNLRAVDINEAGDILTDYIDSNAKFNAVLLKPIPNLRELVC